MRIGESVKRRLMENYDFEILKGDEKIAVLRSIEIPNSRAMWPKITELANKFCEPGYRIRVTDQAGGIVMLVGVDTARRHFGGGVAA